MGVLEISLPMLMLVGMLCFLLLGYPVAFTIGGTALFFAGIGILFGLFDPVFLQFLPARIFGVMSNITLIAIPLFVFMGMVLAYSGIAEDLLEAVGSLFGKLRGGLALSVVFVGALLAASTGIVGATVVTMTVIALPVMLRHKYDVSLATGTIASAGTLGQIVPPSIVLILLSDVLSRAEVSTGKIFMAALVPSMWLIIFYTLYIVLVTWLYPEKVPVVSQKIGISKNPSAESKMGRRSIEM